MVELEILAVCLLSKRKKISLNYQQDCFISEDDDQVDIRSNYYFFFFYIG